MKLHIVYTPTGEKVADADVEKFIAEKVSRIRGTDQELQVNIANEIVLLGFKVFVKRGLILPEDILFYHEDITKTPIKVDTNGTFDYYPIGFAETAHNFLTELFG